MRKLAVIVSSVGHELKTGLRVFSLDYLTVASDRADFRLVFVIRNGNLHNGILLTDDSGFATGDNW